MLRTIARHRKKKKSSGKFSKKEIRNFQKMHAKRRAVERYGLVLNRKDRREILAKIGKERDDIFHLRRESGTRSHWFILHKENCMVIVYDKGKKNIATFLPLGKIRSYFNEISGEMQEQIETMLIEKGYMFPWLTAGEEEPESQEEESQEEEGDEERAGQSPVQETEREESPSTTEQSAS